MDLSRQIEHPRGLTNSEESLVIDTIRQEQQEMEKLLKRKKELILREEEEELQHPRTELSALDRLSQRNGFQLSLPEPVRVPRFANKDWGKPGTVEEHKKITLAWCVGSALFASLLGFIVVTWRCCRKKENKPSPIEFARNLWRCSAEKRRRKLLFLQNKMRRILIELEPLK